MALDAAKPEAMVCDSAAARPPPRARRRWSLQPGRRRLGADALAGRRVARSEVLLPRLPIRLQAR